MSEIKLMKGNEVIAEAAIRCGCDGYFGYPITPQSEVMETLMLRKPWEETGMVVLQAESEIASINMVYGGAACGKKVMTSSSSPGVSLMQEGLTYIAGAELPCLVVDVVRGGPGLGTIQPAQSDYFQATIKSAVNRADQSRSGKRQRSNRCHEKSQQKLRAVPENLKTYRGVSFQRGKNIVDQKINSRRQYCPDPDPDIYLAHKQRSVQHKRHKQQIQNSN